MTNQRDPITGATKASGFSIDIFEEAVKRLPFALPYEYVAFDTSRDTSTGSYDDFVHQVYLKVLRSLMLFGKKKRSVMLQLFSVQFVSKLQFMIYVRVYTTTAHRNII